MGHLRRIGVLLGITSLGFCAETGAPAEGKKFRMTERIVYGSGGGRPLLLDLARPVEAAPASRPAVVFIHGGGWAGADRTNGHPIIGLLAENGFVAASIDYRLSGEAGFPAQLEDSKCAVRFLRAHAAEYGIDPARVGVVGGSAGGHLAALVGLVPAEAGFEGTGGWQEASSAVAAVADLYGISDVSALVDEGKLVPQVRQLMRSSREDAPEAYRHASPITWVKRGAPPFYLAHGDRDDLVVYAHSERLLAALRAAGTDATLRPMPCVGHGSIATLPAYVKADLVAFFARHLGAPAAR